MPHGDHQSGQGGWPAAGGLGRITESSMPGRRRSGRAELPHDLAVHHQRGRQPACHCGRCPVARRHVLVPDGHGTRKGRNVARDPRCSVAVSSATRTSSSRGRSASDRAGREARIAKAWADNGWPAEPDDSGRGITAPFNAPSQGPPPWNVYRIEPHSAIVTLATEPGGRLASGSTLVDRQAESTTRRFIRSARSSPGFRCH